MNKVHNTNYGEYRAGKIFDNNVFNRVFENTEITDPMIKYFFFHI